MWRYGLQSWRPFSLVVSLLTIQNTAKLPKLNAALSPLHKNISSRHPAGGGCTIALEDLGSVHLQLTPPPLKLSQNNFFSPYWGCTCTHCTLLATPIAMSPRLEQYEQWVTSYVLVMPEKLIKWGVYWLCRCETGRPGGVEWTVSLWHRRQTGRASSGRITWCSVLPGGGLQQQQQRAWWVTPMTSSMTATLTKVCVYVSNVTSSSLALHWVSKTGAFLRLRYIQI